MKAVVVGASGFLGSRLARRLVETGSEVYGTWFTKPDRLPQGLAGRVHVEEMNPSTLPVPDAVFVCAAHIPYGAMDAPSNELTEANLRLPERCAAWFPRTRVVFASSVAVFGDAPAPRTEKTPPAPRDAYGRSKLSGEAALRHHPSFAIVRFTSLFGPGMTAPTFLRAIVGDALDRKGLRIFGDGSRTQDYLFIDDAVELLAAAARSPVNGIFLGASGVAVSNLRAASAVAAEIPGTTIEFTGQDATPSLSYDPSWTFTTLGFSPAVGFEEGLGRTVRGD